MVCTKKIVNLVQFLAFLVVKRNHKARIEIHKKYKLDSSDVFSSAVILNEVKNRAFVELNEVNLIYSVFKMFTRYASERVRDAVTDP